MVNSAAEAKKSTITINAAIINDAASLSELCRETFIESFGHCYSEENLNAYLDSAYTEALQKQEIEDPKVTLLLAYCNDELAGFVKFGRNKLPVTPDSNDIVEIHRMYVLKKFQGNKIGELLMLDALEAANKQGIREVYLGVWQENPRAQKFYGRFGFEEFACYHFNVGEQTDRENIMRLIL